jgi:hypothetical protein
MPDCPQCGADEPIDNTFCTNCGTRLIAETSVPSPSLAREWFILAGIVVIVVCVVGALVFAVTRLHSTSHSAVADRVAPSTTSAPGKVLKPASDDETHANLVQALGAETKIGGYNEPFTDNINTLRATDPSLPWNDIRVAVRDVQRKGDRGLVCMSEQSPSGRTFVIAYIVIGPNAGEYETDGKGCPTPLTANSVALLGSQPAQPPPISISPADLSNGDSNTQISLSSALEVESKNFDSPALDGVAGLTERFGDAAQPGDNGVVCVSMHSSTGTNFESIEVRTGSHNGTYTGTGACPPRPTVADAIELGHHW